MGNYYLIYRLWDNLDDKAITDVVNDYYSNIQEKGLNINELALKIASEAETFSNKR